MGAQAAMGFWPWGFTKHSRRCCPDGEVSQLSARLLGRAGTRREQLALGAGGGEAMAQVTEAVKQVELANSSLFCLQAALCPWLNALLVLL